MFTPEEILFAVGKKISEVEYLFGIDAATWYKMGFMECVEFIVNLNEQAKIEELEKVNRAFNKKQSITGGIN